MLLATAVQAQEWVEIRSAHFSVVTDAGQQRGRELAGRFEQMRAAFGVLFNLQQVGSPLPIQIVAFRNNHDFRRFAPVPSGRTKTLAAAFSEGGEDRALIAIDLSFPDGWPTAAREYLRMLLAGNFPPMPAWFDRGFAEYCLTAKVQNNQIEFGTVPEPRPAILTATPWMHIDDLLRVRREQRELTENSQPAIFAAESWVLVHYLMGNRLNRQLAQFLELTEKEGMSIRAAVQQAFLVTPRELEVNVRNYFLSGRMTVYRASASPGFGDGGPYESRVMSPADWTLVSADLLYHSPDHHEEGVRVYEEVVKRNPNDSAAHRALGYDDLTHHDFAKAAEHLQRAAAADADHPQSHYLNALLLSRRAAVEGKPLDTAAARKEAEAALQLDPYLAGAYYLLAGAFAAENNPEGQRAAIAKALELSPRDETYMLAQAQEYVRAQNLRTAEPMLEYLEQSEDQQIADAARNLLRGVPEQHQPSSSSQPAGVVTTSPQWQQKDTPEEPMELRDLEPASPPRMASIRFLKGQLLRVECAAGLAATLTVSSGGKTWTMFTADRRSLLLIGADAFHCDWTNRQVSANYRLQPDGRGELVSLEIN